MSTRVLIVDDEAMVRTGLRMILESQEDLEVVGEAADGREALASMRLGPDVVLMDIRMPTMDGIEATRRLTTAGAPAKVIVLTTFDLDEHVVDALRAGASAFLTKDAPADKLLEAVRVVANGEAEGYKNWISGVTWLDSGPKEDALQFRSFVPSYARSSDCCPSSTWSSARSCDGLHLKTGKTAAIDGITAKDGFDLPRGAGTTAKAKRRAVIPDPRNDENLAVAQTHLAFIRFHNRVVDTLPASVPPAQRFAEARAIVTKHYQWMLRTDYLPRICQPGVVTNVFSKGRKAFEVGVSPTAVPTMPIEFSVAAFRLGHSMIRRTYNWNKIFDAGSGSLDLLFTFSAGSGNLGGGPRLPSNWIADFRRLYDFAEAGRPGLAVPEAKFNRAMRIDTTLVRTLRNLPGFPADEASLALRNLTRAKMVRLATGQQMVTFLKGRDVTVTRLTNAQIRNGSNGAKLDGLTQPQRAALVKDTPLWFYILREAEFNAGRLKGVGARIVAETFHRAMEGSAASIVRDPAWRPTLGPDDTTFRMVDLLLFAFEGKKALLAPLG